MNYKFLLYILLFFVFVPYSFWCKYESEIAQCNQEVKKFLPINWWKYIYSWSSIKSFEDFVCLQASPEERIAQIALDSNFSEIDEEVNEYIFNLESQKDRFFWRDSKFNYFDAVNYIFENTKNFENKYKEACVQSLSETSECTRNNLYTIEWEKPSVWIETAINYLSPGGKCYQLINIKKDIISSVSYNILLINQQQVQSDQHKLYEQETRTKYNKVIDLMMINLWYIERIWQKTPSFTKNPL